MWAWVKGLFNPVVDGVTRVKQPPLQKALESALALVSRKFAERVMFSIWKHRYSVSATVVRACRNCGAPGLYHANPDGPGALFNPARAGQSVGEICPNCGSPRFAGEDRGELCHTYAN